MIIMTKIDKAAELLESATIELKSLQRHWNSLAWWERNASLEAAFDYIFNIQHVREYSKRCEMIQDRAETLDIENMKTYPSEEDLKNDPDMCLYFMDNPRLNLGICIGFIEAFGPDDIAELADYMNVTPDKCVLIDVLNNTSLAHFYALRNRIGSMVKGQIQQAHA